MISLAPTPPSSLASTKQEPPKSLIRRSTLVRKRDEEEEDFLPSSPGKKARVSFDSDVEIHLVPDVPDAPEFVREEVRLAFEKRAWGDCTGYEKLKRIYDPQENEDHESPEMMKRHTTGLLCNVSYINRESADLFKCVINSNWLAMSDDYLSLFMRLLSNVLSGQGMFLGDTLRMLVENLTSKPPSSQTRSVVQPASRFIIRSRVHKVLQYLLQLFPPAARVLSAVLVSAFPHQTDTCRAHVVYVKNLIKVINYVPVLASQILGLITERLVKIDVQVQVDLEDLTDEVGESLINSLPQLQPNILEDLDDDDESGSESETEDDENAEAERTKEIVGNVEKMDTMLDLMFTYYNQSFSKGSGEDKARITDMLISQFATIVLPAHRSRHTQFLLFHFLQKSPNYVDTFIGVCVEITFDRKQPAPIRQAAGAYLASFVARGIHVPSTIVCDVFDYIGRELDRLRRQFEPTCRGPDLKRYSNYYNLVQVLLYMFCFRWRDLEIIDEADEDDDELLLSTYRTEHSWRPGVKESLSINIFSKLNPLKVCSPAIINEFARVANHLGVVYVYHLLETNKRLRLSQLAVSAGSLSQYGHPARETALSMNGDESQYRLDEYFPFDPYHLPKSKRWIESDYREWAGVPGLDDEPASDTESDGEEIVGSDAEEGTETDRTGRST